MDYILSPISSIFFVIHNNIVKCVGRAKLFFFVTLVFTIVVVWKLIVFYDWCLATYNPIVNCSLTSLTIKPVHICSTSITRRSGLCMLNLIFCNAVTAYEILIQIVAFGVRP